MDELPVTMNPDEIQYFKNYLLNTPPNFKMVEWGSGGSTIMFLNHMTENRSMISIEHNEHWYNTVTERVKDHPNRSKLTYLFIPPEKPLDYFGYGIPKEETPTYNREYINPHLSFEDITFWDADMILVDGISRGACLATTRIWTQTKNPDVFLHDYVGREQWYDWALDFYKNKNIVGSTLVKLSNKA
jgi:hypothetical protein